MSNIEQQRKEPLQPILQKANVLRLRALLEQRLTELHKRHFKFGPATNVRADTEEETIKWVLSLMDDILPVA